MQWSLSRERTDDRGLAVPTSREGRAADRAPSRRGGAVTFNPGTAPAQRAAAPGEGVPVTEPIPESTVTNPGQPRKTTSAVSA